MQSTTEKSLERLRNSPVLNKYRLVNYSLGIHVHILGLSYILRMCSGKHFQPSSGYKSMHICELTCVQFYTIPLSRQQDKEKKEKSLERKRR